MVIQPSQNKDHKMKTNRLGCIEIDPKIIEEKLKAELDWPYLEDSIPSEEISHINIQEGAEKNFITAVDDAQFTVSADGKLQLINAPLFTQTSDDFIVENDTLKLAKEFVTTQMYAAEVGDLAALIHASGKEDSTLVDEINYINERLEWQEI